MLEQISEENSKQGGNSGTNAKNRMTYMSKLGIGGGGKHFHSFNMGIDGNRGSQLIPSGPTPQTRSVTMSMI